MFIPVCRRPRKYRKQIRKEVEIIGAICRVQTIVTFQEIRLFTTKGNAVFGSTTTLDFEVEHKPKVSYAFTVSVELDKKEYETTSRYRGKYVCEKAKKQYDYQALLEESIQKGLDEGYRDYTVEIMEVSMAMELKEVVHEYEEYVPV